MHRVLIKGKPEMMIKKIMAFSGFLLAIIALVGGALIFEELPQTGAQSPTMVQAPAPTIPNDFDWVTYVQNYRDLTQAGIDTETKATLAGIRKK